MVMDERLERIERLVASSIRLQQSFQAAHQAMQLNLRRMEENWRRNEENWLLIQQDNERLDAQIQESRGLLDQLLQTLAVMQADIVRIDEARALPPPPRAVSRRPPRSPPTRSAPPRSRESGTSAG